MDYTKKKELGEKAMALIADYPLYACTSNIDYDEAIGIAKILFGNIEDAYKEYHENYINTP